MKRDVDIWVVKNPDICHGERTVRGTCISVSTIVQCLGSGVSNDEILDRYPSLPRRALEAMRKYYGDPDISKS